MYQILHGIKYCLGLHCMSSVTVIQNIGIMCMNNVLVLITGQVLCNLPWYLAECRTLFITNILHVATNNWFEIAKSILNVAKHEKTELVLKALSTRKIAYCLYLFLFSKLTPVSGSWSLTWLVSFYAILCNYVHRKYFEIRKDSVIGNSDNLWFMVGVIM